MKKMRYDQRTRDDDEIMREVLFKILDLKVHWSTIVKVKVDQIDPKRLKVEIQRQVQFQNKV